MSQNKQIVYPYIPNSIPATKEVMLRAVNAQSVEAFYADIPESIRFKGKLNLPEPFLAEADLSGMSKRCWGRTPARVSA